MSRLLAVLCGLLPSLDLTGRLPAGSGGNGGGVTGAGGGGSGGFGDAALVGDGGGADCLFRIAGLLLTTSVYEGLYWMLLDSSSGSWVGGGNGACLSFSR